MIAFISVAICFLIAIIFLIATERKIPEKRVRYGLRVVIFGVIICAITTLTFMGLKPLK